jgi:hypothetical protein
MFLTKENELRSQINRRYICDLASKMNYQMVTMFAQDRITSKGHSLTQQMQHYLRCLTDTPSLYPGFLHLIPGVNIIMLENIYPNLFIMNGSIGTVVATSPQSSTLDNAFVVIQFDWLKEISIYPGLPPGCLLFQPSLCHYKHKGLHYARTQFPFCISKAMTVFKFQGKTAYDGLALCYDKKMTLPMLYVALSRVQSLNKLHLKGDIPYADFQTKWPTELKLELKRLKELGKQSLQLALSLFPPCNAYDEQVLLHEEQLEAEEMAFLSK